MKILANYFTDMTNSENTYTEYRILGTNKTYKYKTGESMPEAFWYVMSALSKGYEIIDSNIVISKDSAYRQCTAIYETY